MQLQKWFFSLLLLILLGGCNSGGTGWLQAWATPSPVTVASPVPPTTPTGLPLPTPSQGPIVEDRPPHEVARAILDRLPAPLPAPSGWQVALCEGGAPMICIETAEFLAALELSTFAMSTLPDFQTLLARHGLDAQTLDTASELYQQAAVLVLADFVANHFAVIKADRQVTFGEDVVFTPLETRSAQFGSLPGVQYGFVRLGPDGQVAERVVAFAAFDANHLYILNAVYDPAAIPNFPSDEALLSFEPYLDDLVAQLEP